MDQVKCLNILQNGFYRKSNAFFWILFRAQFKNNNRNAKNEQPKQNPEKTMNSIDRTELASLLFNQAKILRTIGKATKSDPILTAAKLMKQTGNYLSSLDNDTDSMETSSYCDECTEIVSQCDECCPDDAIMYSNLNIQQKAMVNTFWPNDEIFVYGPNGPCSAVYDYKTFSFVEADGTKHVSVSSFASKVLRKQRGGWGYCKYIDHEGNLKPINNIRNRFLHIHAPNEVREVSPKYKRPANYDIQYIPIGTMLKQVLRGHELIVRFNGTNYTDSNGTQYPTLRYANIAHGKHVGLKTIPDTWSTFKTMDGKSINRLDLEQHPLVSV